MNVQDVFPLGWYLRVAAGTELRWMYANGVAPTLFQQGSHVRSSTVLDPRDLEAAVAQSGAASVEPWCKRDDHWCGWCCWDCR